jgi:hypothetical protein
MDNLQKLTTLGAEDTRGRQIKKTQHRKLWLFTHDMRRNLAKDTGHRTQDTGHRTQDTGHRTQDTVHRIQDTGYRTQDTVHRTQYKEKQHTNHNSGK